MLAVFHESVAKSPAGLKTPDGNGRGEGKKSMLEHFSSVNTSVVSVNLGTHASIAYATEKQNPLLPRLFAVVDDIFCIFEGHIENVAVLKQQYGLNKSANEVSIIIEAYRTLRDRGPYPADQVVRDIKGKFAFILFDLSAKSTFIAADAEESVPFFWGTDSEGNLVFSGDVKIVKKGCGNSFAPFPKACFFTTSKGLQSYEHPLNELKPIARVDSKGQVCGSDYKVDRETKKATGMHRVGSAADCIYHPRHYQQFSTVSTPYLAELTDLTTKIKFWNQADSLYRMRPCSELDDRCPRAAV
ncbi:hypothetical protein ACLOJK_032762 [Asimina triloba]